MKVMTKQAEACTPNESSRSASVGAVSSYLRASQRTFGVQALACLLFCSVSLHAQQFGNLIYPARGHIQLDEGTVELWIVCGYDVEDKQKAAGTYFNLVFPDPPAHYVLTHIGWGGALAMVGYTFPQQSYVWSEKLNWKPGETHHIAWTWSGRKRSLFVDGRIGRGRPGHGPLQGEGRVDTSEDVVVEDWIHGDLTNAQLMIGRAHSRFTIDELRVSSVARPIEEIARQMNAAPTADAYTLLLDHCDGGETIGQLNGGYEIVDTQFGKGIKLWKEQK
jgi:hypothetical protein